MFEEKNYKVLRQAISPELVDFIYKYFLMKRQVARTFYDTKYISPYNTDWGVWNDQQVPETYSHYADIAMETLLERMLPIMKKETELELIPTYSYARIYKKGDILKRHKDRFSCEVSATINLGGELWPIYLDPNPGLTGDGEYKPGNNPGIKIELNPADMVIYKGELLEHWREAFEGEHCGQVFLHYNNVNTPNSETNKYDTRPHLGLPSDFKEGK